MGMYAYMNTDTNICRLTGFLLIFISFPLVTIINNINSINDLLLNY